MDTLHSRAVGRQALLVGITGFLAVVTLILFFMDLFEGMGRLNDALNAVVSLLSAVLASMLQPFLSRRVSALSNRDVVLGVWAGALAVSYGSWLIMTGRADVERSSYFFFFGNGLIGIWLWVINRMARRQALWPSSLTRLGLVASGIMLVGLLAVYGLLLGADGNEYSPLIIVMGISYLGIGVLYPLWGILLGRWILRRQETPALAVKTGERVR